MKRAMTPTTLFVVFATVFSLGIVQSVCAEQKQVSMTFSGTGAPSTINLQYSGTTTGEENVTGNGTLGWFTFRNVTASAAAPSAQPPRTCSGPTHLYFPRIAGAGIFRFQDGSLLMVELTQGSDCIDLMGPDGPEGHCSLTLNITGGTGRFRHASGGTLK